MTSTPERLLAAYTDLAPGPQRRAEPEIAPSLVEWVDIGFVVLIAQGAFERPSEAVGLPRTETIDRIVARAELHEDEELLRLGWMWVTGTGPGGARILFPLVSRAVGRSPFAETMWSLGRSSSLAIWPYGDAEMTTRIDDGATRRRLAETVEIGGGGLSGGDHLAATAGPVFGRASKEGHVVDGRLLARMPRLRTWARTASEAAGGPAADPVPVDGSPIEMRNHRGVSVVAGVALYVAPHVDRPDTSRESLRRWTERSIDGTAFSVLYGDADRGSSDVGRAGERDATDAGAPLDGPVLLDHAQRSAVRAARTDRLTVVSGPPGTGKSQTLVAAALDAVAHGRSVLVVAPTDAAVAALVELLDHAPGPDPIVFGGGRSRRDVANRLGEGANRWIEEREVARLRAERDRVVSVRDRIRRGMVDALRAESAASSASPALLLRARQVAPGFFDPDADLVAAGRLASEVDDPGGWLFRRRRSRRALDALIASARATGGSEGPPTLDELRSALDEARARRSAAELEATGGLELGEAWDELVAADDAVREAWGAWLDADVRSERRADRRGLRTVGAVAAALRSGRAARRRALAGIPGADLTDVLPVWVATLRDVDDLLPPEAGMFDVVMFDEASKIDQIAAAPSLLRARRAVVIGDARQLRHVSFLSTDDIGTAFARHGLDGALAGQVDPRRSSLFDAATAAAPARFLDEHYRSVPHLISFSAREFYDGELHVATRTPAVDGADRIDTVVVDGERVDGVNGAELDAVMDLIAAHATASERVRSGDDAVAGVSASTPTVGVVTPFRAHADALDERILDRLDLDTIDELRLRTGTVHSFQGCERDVVIVSIGLDPGSAAASLRFVDDPNLFNVMVTRARERVIVVHSLADPVDRGTGLLQRYLRHAETPPSSIVGDGRRGRWSESVTEYVDTGPWLVGYRTGGHTADLALADRTGPNPVGVLCGVHPDGVGAHVDRRIELMRQGWRLTDVYATRWADDLAGLGIEIARLAASSP